MDHDPRFGVPSILMKADFSRFPCPAPGPRFPREIEYDPDDEIPLDTDSNNLYGVLNERVQRSKTTGQVQNGPPPTGGAGSGLLPHGHSPQPGRAALDFGRGMDASAAGEGMDGLPGPTTGEP